MHELNKRTLPSQAQIDAVLTDFINDLAAEQCCDYGMYSRDLAACPIPRGGGGWLMQDVTTILESQSTTSHDQPRH